MDVPTNDIQIYLRTPDYTVGPVQGRDDAITCPVASFLSSFSNYLDCDHERWAKDVSDLPAMYEVFVSDSAEYNEFVDRDQVAHALIQHTDLAPSFFNQSMNVLDILK
jgi:hypothetical protein